MIGGLGDGGAERQLIRLACGLADRGNEVEVFTVAGGASGLSEFRKHGVIHRSLSLNGTLSKWKACRVWLKDFRPDVIHGFMYRSSALACLAGTNSLVNAVVASDFSTATYNSSNRMFRLALVTYANADVVVTQTSLNKSSLEHLAPWLKKKIRIIRNGVDSIRFAPPIEPVATETFTFLVVGTVSRIKNPVRMVRAVSVLKGLTDKPFQVLWCGRFSFSGDDQPSPVWHEAQAEKKRLGVGKELEFRGNTSQIEKAYHEANALVHPSVQEGFPNAVVEGMASGLPIVVGQISDLPLVVSEASNGFVFDQTDSEDIANAMLKMMNTTAEERREMGRRSRDLAVRWFDRDRFIDDYLSLYQEISGAGKLHVG